MSDTTDRTDGHEDTIVRWHFDPDETDPGTTVAEAVAELEGCDTTDLTPLYDCIDRMVGHLFTDPPSAEAQAEVTFSYEGYRITVDQDGWARLVSVGEPTS